MNNAIITNSTNPELGKYQQLAEKCMKLCSLTVRDSKLSIRIPKLITMNYLMVE